MDLAMVKRIGVAAAYKGAKLLRFHFGTISKIEKKGAIDLVTEADIASEKAIIDTIRNVFPEHGLLAEESGLSKPRAQYNWIIDPLDGTTNFAHNLGIFCVSIAFAIVDQIQIGVILNPVNGELFTATQGLGACLNGHPIQVSNTSSVSDSLLVTGFPYDKKDHLKPLLKRYGNCLKSSQGVRRLGSAALDVCFVACGRFDGFWEENLKPWDTAAATLIAAEAGALITDFANRPFTIHKKQILATNGKIHNEMLALLGLKDRM